MTLPRALSDWLIFLLSSSRWPAWWCVLNRKEMRKIKSCFEMVATHQYNGNCTKGTHTALSECILPVQARTDCAGEVHPLAASQVDQVELADHDTASGGLVATGPCAMPGHAWGGVLRCVEVC